jgi:signal transduction histidine kinase/HAMP domain-containing protein
MTASNPQRGKNHADSRQKRPGLGVRIVLWSFLPTALILAAVAGTAFIFYLRAAEDLAVEQNRELARYAAGQLASDLEEYAATLEDISRRADFGNRAPDAWYPALRSQINRLVVFDGGAMVLDSDGDLVAAEPDRTQEIGNNYSDRSYFRDLMRTSQPVFSNILPDGPNGEPIVAVSVPILGQGGATDGALVGMFRLGETAVSAFYGDVIKLRAGGAGRAYLVDGQGRVLFHSNPDQILADRSQDSMVGLALSGEAGAARTLDEEGRDVLASYAPVPDTEWGLIVEKDWTSVVAPIRSREFVLVGLLVLGVLVPGTIVAIGVRSITGPLVDLVEAAQRIARGEYSEPPITDTGGEVGELAAQFNKVAVQLRAAREELEGRVEARTRELSMLLDAVRGASGTLELDQVLDQIAASLAQAAGVHRCVIYLLDENSGRLVLAGSKRELDQQGSVEDRLLVEFEPASDELTRQVLESARPAVSSNPVNEVNRKMGWSSILEIPLVSKGRVLAIAFLGTADPRVEFGAAEVDLAWGIASTAAVAIENARLYDRSQELAIAQERQRLARDLHDAVTQTLFSASLTAEVLPRLWERDQSEARRRLEELRQLTRGALAEMRTLLLELRPAALIETNLGDLMRQLTEAITSRAGVQTRFHTEGSCPMPPGVQVAIYRIAQEAFNNIAKHAGAQTVDVSLTCHEKSGVTLIIRDDGRGFNSDEHRSDQLGLAIMHERAEQIGAVLDVQSHSGEGTEITLKWKGSSVGE